MVCVVGPRGSAPSCSGPGGPMMVVMVVVWRGPCGTGFWLHNGDDGDGGTMDGDGCRVKGQCGTASWVVVVVMVVWARRCMVCVMTG